MTRLVRSHSPHVNVDVIGKGKVRSGSACLLGQGEGLGETEMFYLVEGGGRRLAIYSLGQAWQCRRLDLKGTRICAHERMRQR
jgi:hypothetical protein